ncbi:TIM-barrel domain-containing protein [Streptomyces sp. NPDC054887]
MNGRDLVRSVILVGMVRKLRFASLAWRRRRTDAWERRRGPERARVPGVVTGVEPRPGGGVMRFARSELRVMVAAGGAVFWGWDGAGPEPSYALAGACPEPDTRAELEPDKDGGWQVVSERLTVAVSRDGAVEVRTPGGAVLRRDLPPRWWEPADGGPARWSQRAEVPADARFFGLGGQPSGLRLRDGTYPLGRAGLGGGSTPGEEARPAAAPVHVVVSDSGTHLVFHDNTWEGRMTLREGEEGAGSGHDRVGTSELRMAGGPVRCWVVAGTPSRVLRGWTALTGAPVLPPAWALGVQHVWQAGGGAGGVRQVDTGMEGRGPVVSAVHVDAGADSSTGDGAAGLLADLGASGVRLVSVLRPGGAGVVPGNDLYDGRATTETLVGVAPGKHSGKIVRSAGTGASECNGAGARAARGTPYGERPAEGFSGVWLAGDHQEDRKGAHPESGGVDPLGVPRVHYEALLDGRSRERPFLFSSARWAGAQRYGGTYAEDVPAGWPGLRASLSLALGLGLCGVPYSGTDVGGSGGAHSPELYLRGLQLGAHLPLFRTASPVPLGRGEPSSGAEDDFGPQVLAHAKAALASRERLLPYFVTLAHLARLTGAPYVRPVWWAAPGDRALRDCEDAFLLGDCLLVAPVLEPGADRRAVRLPRGRWYDTATGRGYDGHSRVLLDAPLSRVPVLARAGAVLPVTGEDGGLALEVWAPVAGRTGGGVVIRDTGDQRGRAEMERFTTRMSEGRVVVERKGGGDVGLPVRVRGC